MSSWPVGLSLPHLAATLVQVYLEPFLLPSTSSLAIKETFERPNHIFFLDWGKKCIWTVYSIHLDFLCGSAGKESACNVGDLGSIPGLGRSPGEGKGFPLQYSGLQNSKDCIVHGFQRVGPWLSKFHSIHFAYFKRHNTFLHLSVKKESNLKNQLMADKFPWELQTHVYCILEQGKSKTGSPHFHEFH